MTRRKGFRFHHMPKKAQMIVQTGGKSTVTKINCLTGVRMGKYFFIWIVIKEKNINCNNYLKGKGITFPYFFLRSLFKLKFQNFFKT